MRSNAEMPKRQGDAKRKSPLPNDSLAWLDLVFSWR